MNRQLTVQESRHKLARDICHGKRGAIHQTYRDGTENQLGALGLVLSSIVEVHRRQRMPTAGSMPTTSIPR